MSLSIQQNQMQLNFTDHETGEEYLLTDFLSVLKEAAIMCKHCQGTGENLWTCGHCDGRGYRTGKELLDEVKETRIAKETRAKQER